MMGLDVKKLLVVLKSPERGTFLLPREKLQVGEKKTKMEKNKMNQIIIIIIIFLMQQHLMCHVFLLFRPLSCHHWQVCLRRHHQE